MSDLHPSSKPAPKSTVLITGCSQHGLGHALALAFHATGQFRVFATARDVGRMAGLRDQEQEQDTEEPGNAIETLQLDVLDEQSIARCVEMVRGLIEEGAARGCNQPGLGVLVNNAGGGYNMPVSDISIPAAKTLFELNVWSYVSITQAFLPLLLEAVTAASPGPGVAASCPALIVNNTSISSVEPTPHNSVYHASKAAAAMFSTHMRIELQPFGVRVVDLKTGCVHSRFHANHQAGTASLPPASLYAPLRAQTEKAMRGAFDDREDPAVWARAVVQDLVRGLDGERERRLGGLLGWLFARWGTSRLPLEIWRGTGAWRTWFWNGFFPVGCWDEWWRRSVGLDLLRARVRRDRMLD